MAPFHPAATFINSSICNCSRFDPWLSILLFCFNQFSQNKLNIRSQIQFDFDFFARKDVFCDLQTTLLKLPYLQNVPTHLTWNHLPTPHILLSLVTSSRSCRSTQKHFKDKCFRLKLVMHQSCHALSLIPYHWGKRNVIFTRGGDRCPKYPDCILTMLQALLVE